MNKKKKVAKPSEVETLQKKEIKPQRRKADEWVELEVNNPDKLFDEVNGVLDELIEIYGVERVVAEPIDVFNLIMKKAFAEQIVSGEKLIEWRSYSPHYESRLIDDKVLEFKALHTDNDDVIYCVNEIRTPDIIRFHNYNNTWTLDVKCRFVEVVTCTPESAQYFKEEYNDTTVEEAVKNNKQKGWTPLLFAFHIGEIVAKKGL